MSVLGQKTGLIHTSPQGVRQEAPPLVQSWVCHCTICVQETADRVLPPAAEPGRPSAAEFHIDGAVPHSVLPAPGSVKVWLFSCKCMV